MNQSILNKLSCYVQQLSLQSVLFILLLFTYSGTKAQSTYSITGKVTYEKGAIVSGAVVFLTNTQKITSTNADGEFNLDQLQPGNYELVVKMIGFDPRIQNVVISNQSVNLTVKLTESNSSLNEVVVKGKPDPNREKYLKVFVKNFIGESVNESECKILNPGVIRIHYDKKTDKIEARSEDFIKVENNALGYRINYLLTNFIYDNKNESFAYQGKPYFEELEGTDVQKKQWKAKRDIAYLGSARHFFKALFNNTTEAEGFRMYFLPVTMTPEQASNITPVNSDTLFTVISNDFKLLKLTPRDDHQNPSRLYVMYTREKEPGKFYNSKDHIDLPWGIAAKRYQVSQLAPTKDTILLSKSGAIGPANSIIFNGYWIWERIAELLPFDYSTTAPKPVTGRLQQLVAGLDSFRNKVPMEKVHLHFDKPYYTLGDTIWMKAYVVNQENQLATSSKILYVDLINDRDSVKSSLHLPLSNGLAWGAITLSNSTLKAGNYHIRAYTTAMRSFDEDYFFHKPMRIGNAMPAVAAIGFAQKTIGTKKNNLKADIVTAPVVKDDPLDISVKFFPEGGDLVNGITSKVAFKAIGTTGLGKDVSGYVVDKDNKQVTAIQAEHAGMGTFMLQPEAGNNYTAVIKLINNNERRIPLPKADERGYVLSVKQNEDNVLVSLQVSNDLLNPGEISFVAQQNNTVRYIGKKQLTANTFTTTIPKSRFVEGLVQFTLFSPQYQPVAERLAFIRNADNHLKINLISEKTDYRQRDKVHFNVEVTTREGKPVSGNFSFAITDDGKVPYREADEKTIFSNLLLSSELKGYIEQPNYYFTDTTAVKAKELDNLMLTQGWRRFLWKDIISNNLPAFAYRADAGMAINGTVTRKGVPVHARVSLLINSGTGMVMDTVTNADGQFNFPDFPFKRGTTFNVKAQDALQSKDLKVEINSPNFQPVTLRYAQDFQSPDSNFTAYIENSKARFDELAKYGEATTKAKVLDEVLIKEKALKATAVQHSDNLAGAGNADQTLTFKDLLPCGSNSLAGCLAGRLANVNMTRNVAGALRPVARGFSSPGAVAAWAPTANGTPGDYTKTGNADAVMGIVVNGIMQQDYTLLNVMLASEVSSVEVFRGGGASSLYGVKGANGVLIITTKKGDVDYNAYTSGPPVIAPGNLKTYVYQGGYDMRRQFYFPDYNNAYTDRQKPDLRTTIYWNPNVVTDTNGKGSFEFFNADATGNYRVIAEGLDGTGQLGRIVSQYHVR
jgi:TonB-dependent SusC/RagA subfamily outer membrane receptor